MKKIALFTATSMMFINSFALTELDLSAIIGSNNMITIPTGVGSSENVILKNGRANIHYFLYFQPSEGVEFTDFSIEPAKTSKAGEATTIELPTKADGAITFNIKNKANNQQQIRLVVNAVEASHFE